jgi:hypothetical protein
MSPAGGNRKHKAGKTRKKSREPYVPPRVTFTEIEVNEALMGICKGVGGAGPYGGGCPGGCSGQAS